MQQLIVLKCGKRRVHLMVVVRHTDALVHYPLPTHTHAHTYSLVLFFFVYYLSFKTY